MDDKLMKPETKGGELTPLGTVLRVNRKDGVVSTLAFGLTLSKELGHVVEPYGMKPFVTAPGYNYANLAAGVSVIKPSTLAMGASRVENPYMERGEDGTVRRVTCRMVGFRPAIDGDWYLSDATVTLDLELYLVQDLQAKISRYPVCGTPGIKGERPATWTFQKTDKQGEPTGDPTTRNAIGAMLAWYPVSGEVGLWVDLGHPEIQKAFKEHIQRRKFSERIAQSIARRNVLKCMLGVSTVQAVDGRFQVLVTKTTVGNDKKQLEDMVDGDGEPKTLMGTSANVTDLSPREPILVTAEEVTGELSDEEEAALAEAAGEADTRRLI
jgi:hypothetical protein